MKVIHGVLKKTRRITFEVGENEATARGGGRKPGWATASLGDRWVLMLYPNPEVLSDPK